MSQRRMLPPWIASLLALIVLVSGGSHASVVSRTGIVPASGALQATTPTAFDHPGPTPAAASRSGPPLSLTLTLLFTCCALGLVGAVMVVGFILATRKPDGGNHEAHS